MTPEFSAWVERAKAIKLETILRTRKIELKGRGDKLAGACPKCLGDDRFAVHLGKGDGVFHCRGCNGSGGGAISFVRFLDDCTFLQAVEKITGEPPPVEDRSERKKRDDRVPLGPIVEMYDYTDEGGERLYQVTRHEPKNFRQRKPDPDNPDGGWISNIDGVRLVPYHLPDLVEAVACGQTVFVVEGEKDANTAERLGLVATTNVMGAGKWKTRGANYREHFRAADVVVIPDNDEDPRKGRAHADTIAKDLYEIAERVRVLVLPDGRKDLSVWVENGGTREVLDALVEDAPEYMNGYDPSGDASLQQPPQPPVEAPATITLQSVETFLSDFVAPDYLIDGIMQRRFVYSFTGQTGHAKTAIALLLAELVSNQDTNASFGTHRVEKGNVVYFVGENPDDVRMRLIGAYSQRHDDPMRDHIWFIPGVFDIAGMMTALSNEIASRIKKADLIIVDTSAAYFLGNEELSNTQMGAHARMLRRLTELPGAPCVFVLCHPIKHAQEPSHLLPRGGGAFLAEVDGNLTAWKKRFDLIELHYSKMRGAGFEPISFKLERIDAPKLVDAKGRAIPTIRAVAITEKEEEQGEVMLLTDENVALVTLFDHPGVSLYRISELNNWRNERGEVYKTRAQRAVEELVKAKPPLLRVQRRKFELTDAGRKTAEEAKAKFAADRMLKDTDEMPRLFND